MELEKKLTLHHRHGFNQNLDLGTNFKNNEATLYPHRKKIDWLSGVNVAAMLRCFVSPRDITYKLKLMSDLMDHPRSHYQLGHICSI